MDEWKLETTTANALFEQGHYLSAEHHYLSACYRADALVAPSNNPEEGVVALVVSYQNLADLYRAQGQHQEALNALQAAHARLSHALMQPDICHEHQQALLRGTGQTRLDIMNTAQWLGVQTRHAHSGRKANTQH
ncbi:hypothetical protein [Cobetia sp. L2A1]|uniref:hypothetical protein n=1 Tax=Cobetia sp. L2A1 TaxID=2686360 RepID=UPI00131C3B62|nr:hypothetical protein [Cobetia sp. L2A1]